MYLEEIRVFFFKEITLLIHVASSYAEKWISMNDERCIDMYCEPTYTEMMDKIYMKV